MADRVSAPPMPRAKARWGLSVTLMVLTLASTTFAGSVFAQSFEGGLAYSLPLMAILLTHEFGHYIAGRIHRVSVSPPYCVPMIPPLGTLGAVIVIGDRIERRNALLDVGAAGPLAGLAVAIPVLIYGLAASPVAPVGSEPYWLEGRSLLYLALVHAVKGPIPEGHDIMLGPTAFAGWVGLLLTMINLVPVAQLDGGHIAYAVLRRRQLQASRWFRRVLPALAIAIALAYALPAYLRGASGEQLTRELLSGIHWLVWWLVLSAMVRLSGVEHPDTDDEPLSPRRRAVGVLCLVLFLMLFMPFWLKEIVP